MMASAAPVPAPIESDPAPAPIDVRADHAGALLLALAIAMVAHLFGLLVRSVVPGWPISPVVPVVCFGLALLAFYRHRWTRLHRPFGSRVPIYLAELVLLLVVTRLAAFVLTPWRLLEVAPRWWTEPTAVFDVGFLLDAFLVGGAWLIGHLAGSAVDQLHVQPGELRPATGDDDDLWERSQAGFDHRAAQRQIGTLVWSGAAVIVVLLALIGMARPPGALLVEATVAAVVGLVAGLLLLGWSEVTLLDTLWRLDRLAPPAAFLRRWYVWLLAVLIGVALLGLVLPHSFAVDPLVLVMWLLTILTGIVQVLLFLLILPFMWLASLFGLGSAGGPAAAPPALPPAPAPAATDWSLLEALRSLAFWAITLGLVFYAVRTLYQSQWGFLRHLPRLPLLATVGRLWRALMARLRQGAGELAAAWQAVTSARAARRANVTAAPRAPRPSDARGLVQVLYLSLVDRAGRRGLPRRRGMTAAEYSQFLADRLTPAEPSSAGAGNEGEPETVTRSPGPAVAALDTLTVAFLEARYSRHPVDDGDVGRARGALQRLLQLLRRRTPKAPEQR